MNIEIDENSIQEIEKIIIPTFVEHYSNKCTEIGAIALALQGIIEIVDKVKKEMKGENNG